ncbi:MAG: hypothetical protein WD080_01925 [Egibacteraceae bacterium]
MTPTGIVILAQRTEWGSHMMDGWGAGWMWAMSLFWMLLLVALVVGIVWAVTRTGRPPERPEGAGRAREILDERYARGEVSTEEYRERLDALR